MTAAVPAPTTGRRAGPGTHPVAEMFRASLRTAAGRTPTHYGTPIPKETR